MAFLQAIRPTQYVLFALLIELASVCSTFPLASASADEEIPLGAWGVEPAVSRLVSSGSQRLSAEDLARGRSARAAAYTKYVGGAGNSTPGAVTRLPGSESLIVPAGAVVDGEVVYEAGDGPMWVEPGSPDYDGMYVPDVHWDGDLIEPHGELAPCYFYPPWCNFDVFFGPVATKSMVLGDGGGGSGITEGIIFSGPVFPYHGLGYELGLRGVHTRFAGYEARGIESNDNRNQFFFTAGLFRRPYAGVGLQFAAAWDYLFDDFAGEYSIGQVRGEIGYVGPLKNEFGFWFASAVNSELVATPEGELRVEPLGLYALYLRRKVGERLHMRPWAGFSSESDILLGSDAWVSLGPRTAVRVASGYVMPDGAGGADAASREGWSLGVEWVFSPIGPDRRWDWRAFGPLQGVAGTHNLFPTVR